MSSLGAISRRALRIYDDFYSDRLKRRFKVCKVVFASLADEIGATLPGYQIKIDDFALAEAIRSYFFDVIRYKEYHFNPESHGEPPLDLDEFSQEWVEMIHRKKRINANKVAALTAKWLLQYRPISVERDLQSVSSDTENFVISSINEFFALNVALHSLGISVNQMNPDRVRELVYNMRFRDFDEGTYFIIFDAKKLVLKD